MLYLISYAYVPGVGCGVRYDDPAFGIAWPLPVSVISERDRTWPLVCEQNTGNHTGYDG